MKSAFRAILICGAALSLSGCNFIDWLVQAIEGIMGAPEAQVRIAGVGGFNFAKKDSKDGFTPSQGWMCVVHDPGCGTVGNDGTDKFFVNGMPPLAKVTNVSFEAIAPGGLPATTGTGVGVGSYGANLVPGPMDGSQPIMVRWSNTCDGSTSPYYSKPVFYRISFILSLKKGTDLGEDSPDPNSSSVPPTCAPASFTAPPPDGGPSGPSNWAGAVIVCNPGNLKPSLVIKATLTTPLSSTATGKTSMNETDVLSFIDQGNGVFKSDFKTAPDYKQGSWTINQVQVSGVTGVLNNIKANLPGPPGSPVLDFTGGSCAIL